MPFKSEAQRRYMHMYHPEVASRWEAHTTKKQKRKMPYHVEKAHWSDNLVAHHQERLAHHQAQLDRLHGFRPQPKSRVNKARLPGETPQQTFQRHQHQVAAGVSGLAAIPAVMAMKSGLRATEAMKAGKTAEQALHQGAQLRRAAMAPAFAGLGAGINALPTPRSPVKTKARVAAAGAGTKTRVLQMKRSITPKPPNKYTRTGISMRDTSERRRDGIGTIVDDEPVITSSANNRVITNINKYQPTNKQRASNLAWGAGAGALGGLGGGLRGMGTGAALGAGAVGGGMAAGRGLSRMSPRSAGPLRGLTGRSQRASMKRRQVAAHTALGGVLGATPGVVAHNPRLAAAGAALGGGYMGAKQLRRRPASRPSGGVAKMNYIDAFGIARPDLVSKADRDGDRDSERGERGGREGQNTRRGFVANTPAPRQSYAVKPESPIGGKGRAKYPMHDLPHARNAISRVAQHGSPEEKRRVHSMARRKFPELARRSEVVETSKAATPPFVESVGDRTVDGIANFTFSDPGVGERGNWDRNTEVAVSIFEKAQQNKKRKWTEAEDDAWDRAHGIKEDSPQDKRIDRMRGLQKNDVVNYQRGMAALRAR